MGPVRAAGPWPRRTLFSQGQSGRSVLLLWASRMTTLRNGRCASRDARLTPCPGPPPEDPGRSWRASGPLASGSSRPDPGTEGPPPRRAPWKKQLLGRPSCLQQTLIIHEAASSRRVIINLCRDHNRFQHRRLHCTQLISAAAESRNSPCGLPPPARPPPPPPPEPGGRGALSPARRPLPWAPHGAPSR